jgi:hypothetical protein
MQLSGILLATGARAPMGRVTLLLLAVHLTDSLDTVAGTGNEYSLASSLVTIYITKGMKIKKIHKPYFIVYNKL